MSIKNSRLSGFFMLMGKNGPLPAGINDITAECLRNSKYGSDGESTQYRFNPSIWLFVSNPQSPIIRTFRDDDFFHIHCGYLHKRPVLEKDMVDLIWSGAEGIYSAIHVDLNSGSVRLVSDPSSFKRIYLYDQAPVIAVSDSLGMIKAAFPTKLAQNESDKCFFLTYGYYPKNNTVYNSVHSINPGQIHEIDGNGKFISKATRRAQTNPSPSTDSPTQPVDALYSRISKALDDYTLGLKNVAVMVGGFDSALVATLLKKRGLEVTGYTFRYGDARYNQKKIEDLVSFSGIDHVWIDITPRMIGEGLQLYSQAVDQPTNWVAYIIQTFSVAAEMARRGHEAIFTGDGCDGLFYGYPGVYRNARILSREITIPQWINALLTRVLNVSILERNIGHPWRLLMRLSRNLSSPMVHRLVFYFKIMDVSTISCLFKMRSTLVRDQIRSGEEEILEAFTNGMPPLKTAYRAKQLHGSNKTKVVAAMRASGLPLYSPFFHPDVKNLVDTFPENLLRPEGVNSRFDNLGKHILTQMAADKNLLPQNVVFQKKMSAVTGPTDWWLESHFTETIGEMLKNIGLDPGDSMVQSLLSAPWIERWYRRHISEDDLTKHALTLLASYASYFEYKRT